MNVRFAAQALRCRVTRAELDRLLTGRSVVLEVCLPHEHSFRMNVRPAALGTWQLESDPTGFWLAIPRTQLESLCRALPSKEGIEQRFDTSNGGVLVSFEVDLRQ